MSIALSQAAQNSIMNNAVGVPAGYVMQLDGNGIVSWVPPQLVGSITGTSSSHHGIDPMPDTERSDDSQSIEELADIRNVVSAQAKEIQRLRTEMDEIKALIKDSRSRQLNGAGYWDPA